MIFDFGKVGAATLQPYIYCMKKLKYILDDFRYLKALNSPFKPFKPKFYAGKIAIGTPYFYPRKWVKATPELAFKATKEEIERQEKWNKLNPQYARTIKPFGEIYQEKMRYSYPVPKRIGFDIVGLGWKSKWTDTDYRFEWAPLISFVFFKWQIAVSFIAPEQDMYWSCWLYYERNTDKTKSKRERIKQCREEFRCVWVRYKDGTEEKIDYYNLILKEKYLK